MAAAWRLLPTDQAGTTTSAVSEDAPTTATVPGHLAWPVARRAPLMCCSRARPHRPDHLPEPRAGAGAKEPTNRTRRSGIPDLSEPNLWRLPRPAGRAMQPGTPAAINR